MAGLLEYLESVGKQRLPKEQEARFQQDVRFAPGWNQWFREFSKKRGAAPNVAPGGDYNYRAAWLLGSAPELDPGTGEYHGFSSAPVPPFARPFDLKAAGHPTMWKEQFMGRFGVNPDVAARDGAFTPEMDAFVSDALRASARRGLLDEEAQ